MVRERIRFKFIAQLIYRGTNNGTFRCGACMARKVALSGRVGNKFSRLNPNGGASQFLNSGGKFSLARGFSPVMMVEKRRKAVLTASVCRETR
jgi:hypothetical protein